jgi:hypothetical protein
VVALRQTLHTPPAGDDGMSDTSGATTSETDSDAESERSTHSTAGEPTDILGQWGIHLGHSTDRRTISIVIQRKRPMILTGVIQADFMSIRRRILRCSSAEDATKVLRAWVKIMYPPPHA